MRITTYKSWSHYLCGVKVVTATSLEITYTETTKVGTYPARQPSLLRFNPSNPLLLTAALTMPC
jgi:hypothetical protein